MHFQILDLRRKMKAQSSSWLRKPIQLTSQLTLPHPESTAQPNTFSDSRPQTKYIPIPHTGSGIQAKLKMISREIPIYPNPMYRSLSEPVKKPLQDLPRKLTDLDI